MFLFFFFQFWPWLEKDRSICWLKDRHPGNLQTSYISIKKYMWRTKRKGENMPTTSKFSPFFLQTSIFKYYHRMDFQYIEKDSMFWWKGCWLMCAFNLLWGSLSSSLLLYLPYSVIEVSLWPLVDNHVLVYSFTWLSTRFLGSSYIMVITYKKFIFTC